MPQPTVQIHPLIQGLPRDRKFRMDILVRVVGPEPAKADALPRPPLHLAVVLDRSGSMSGSPLEEAKRCAVALMERLGPEDRIALVTYDNSAQVVHPLARVKDPDAFRRLVGGVRSGGCTNLHAGWQSGVAELQTAHGPKILSRLLLLSDGRANEGVTDLEELAGAAQGAQAQGICTSTCGLGGAFSEELMTRMARAGQGRAYYGESAEDLMAPFMTEFDLLDNLFARDLVLSLDLPEGVKATQLSDFTEVRPGAWAIPELPYASEYWAVFRLEGRAPRAGRQGPADLRIVARLEGRPLRGDEPIDCTGEAVLPLLDARALATLLPDPKVQARLRLLESARLQDLAYRACLEGDLLRVQKLLDEIRALSGDDPLAQAQVQELEAMARRRDIHALGKEFGYLRASTSQTWDPMAFDDVERKMHRDRFQANRSYNQRRLRQGKAEPPPPAAQPPDTPPAP